MSDIKLIKGNFKEKVLQILDKSVDFIIADIPWTDKVGEITYNEIFQQLSRVLKDSGICAITVTTSSSIPAFIEYCIQGNNHFRFNDILAFVDSYVRFGNVLILLPKNQKRKTNPYRVITCSYDNRELYEFLIKNYSCQGDTVFDPFMGNGMTGKVCRYLDRYFIGIEVNDYLYDEAVANV